MPSPVSKLRIALSVSLGACAITWSLAAFWVVLRAIEQEPIGDTFMFFALILAVATTLLGVLRIAVWTLTKLQLQSVGAFLEGATQRKVPDLRAVADSRT